MRIVLAAAFVSLGLLSASSARAQKPASEPAKTDHPASPPSPAPAPSPTHTAPQPTHTEPGRVTGPGRTDTSKNSKISPAPQPADPDRLPRVPRAHPVGPEKIKGTDNAQLRKPAGRGQTTLVGNMTSPAVVRRMPGVFWPSPMTIQQGEPLAAALSGASADVSGTFSYSPGLGYVPPKGDCAVSIQFEPSDLVHYSPSSATVVVRVQ